MRCSESYMLTKDAGKTQPGAEGLPAVFFARVPQIRLPNPIFLPTENPGYYGV